ncbi:hypothetical protein pipiens_016284 [Culex pipiens pipiens]|uniref:non-specific serine/threonine protein kinase n=1 Tax=Culex pipiens pipiens TaxID=38569 RepID=A0ABD1CLZ5_CULPP
MTTTCVGKYGTVRRAVDKKTGVHYAAKFLRRRRRGQCCAKEINHEIAVLMLCASSQHIVRLHAVHETRSETALILELATGGELQTIIDNKGQLSEEKARTCMREVLRALNHLHKQSIIHLDLKPQNILLIGNDVEDGLKLCDFGIARIIGDTGKIMEILGTPDYVAPEVLQYEPLSLRTDIWSIGVLTYVLLTGYSPFGGDNKQETSLNITKCLLDFPEYLFENVSEDAIDFIKCALRIKPKERPTVEECLEHRWLKEEAENTHKVPKDPLTATANTTITVVAKQLPQEEDEPSCPLIIENVPLLRPSNGHHNGHGNNGVSAELPEEAKSKPSSQDAEDDESETNKENVLQVQNASTPAPQVSVVEIVTVSLFPDAPTTPKVSRKAPPSEQQQNGQLNHGSHNHHHHHHHHHLSHHHHSRPTYKSSSSEQNLTIRCRSPPLCFDGERILPRPRATLCCLKCSEETMGGGTASAAGLAVAVATVASRKTLQCGDKGIIC